MKNDAFPGFVFHECGVDPRHGDRQPVLLGVKRQPVGFGALRLVVEVAVAEFVEFQVAVLAIDVQRHGLQHVEQQRLPHDVQIGAQRIEDAHAALRGAGGQPLVVGALRERVGHDLREAVGRKEIRREIHQAVPIGTGSVGERRTHVRGQLDVVVAVDSENLLHQVGLAPHVHAVGRHGHGQFPVALLGEYLHLERAEDPPQRLLGNLLADQGVDPPQRDVEDEIADRGGVDVRDVARNRATGQFLHQ